MKVGSIAEKAQQEQANDIRLTLKATVEGLSPGSPEREAAFNKALENIASRRCSSNDTNCCCTF